MMNSSTKGSDAMKQSLFINSDEMITLWLLSMLHTAILAEGLTEEYKADLQRLNKELKVIVKRAGLGRYTPDVLLPRDN